MTYDILGPGALDYVPCRYGTSKLIFRGPQRVLEDPYVAFIGGTTTFGKFLEQPFPLRVEHMTGVPSVNFGQVNAGLDVFLRETVVTEAANVARVTVVEVLGATHASNRLYRVHPRRNDRFLGAEPELARLYPEVDFTKFSFVRHMLRHLYHLDEGRFELLRKVFQKLWMRRMRELLGRLSPEVILLRIGDGESGERWMDTERSGAAMVTDNMLDELGGAVSDIVDVQVQDRLPDAQTRGMVFDLMEQAAANSVHGPQVHQAVATALRPVLDRLM